MSKSLFPKNIEGSKEENTRPLWGILSIKDEERFLI